MLCAFRLAQTFRCPVCHGLIEHAWPSGFPLDPAPGRDAVAQGTCPHCSLPIQEGARPGAARRWERRSTTHRYIAGGPYEDVPVDATGNPLWEREWRVHDLVRGESIESYPTRAQARRAARLLNGKGET